MNPSFNLSLIPDWIPGKSCFKCLLPYILYHDRLQTVSPNSPLPHENIPKDSCQIFDTERKKVTNTNISPFPLVTLS